MKKIALGLAVTALLAISAGTAMTAPASAAPIIIRQTITTPIFETGLPHDCRPGLTGTIVGTEVVRSQSVETLQGFHIHGTIVDTARIDWSDGSYTLIHSVDHFRSTRSDKAPRCSRTRTRIRATSSRPAVCSNFGTRSMRSSTSQLPIPSSESIWNKGHFHFFGDC